ncbi:MAG: hypothetical protein ACYC5K_02480 [Saccharofermentanales bacterium]
MTVIEIVAHGQLPATHLYDLFVAGSLAQAQAEFAARYPAYNCPAVYVCGARFWFVMEWKR